MKDHYYAVIMAGGGGTRLWPLSRQTRPKQMLRLVDERTLFQTAVQRLDGLFTPDRIFVVTVEEQARELQAQCPEIPAENFLLEPMPRGTASVVGLAAVALEYSDPQAVMAVLTADHIIKNEGKYLRLLVSAYDAAQDGYLVTLGIAPTYPATEYGYIQQGELIGGYQDLEVYRAARFREKPNAESAREMLAGGDHAWNSGMFVWRVDRILAEIERQMPELASKLAEISGGWNQASSREVVLRIWPGIRPQTIDFGIMENARDVAVIPAEGLGWSDVGSWDALCDVLPSDENGNIVVGGTHIPVDTRNSLIYTTQDRRLIVTIGVEDLVVVDTEDVLLVGRKDQAQKVRQVVKLLKQSNGGYV
ncbi:MAG: mannose-1-phosphate guanylyltransferase [Chloroflexi bacterium]|nr:mannose-1-phosphate guanylyltransferase [Chloroflexota bacterium]MBU1661665.1 mannose-1-phosphate guanylyltransferase [Chloroflexota bacterium]